MASTSMHSSRLDIVAQAHVEGRKVHIGVDLASEPSISTIVRSSWGIGVIDIAAAKRHAQLSGSSDPVRPRYRFKVDQAEAEARSPVSLDTELMAKARLEAAAHCSARQRFFRRVRTLLGSSLPTAELPADQSDRGGRQ